MKRLDFQELAAIADEFDAAIARTPEIDRFCSSSSWVLPARSAFAPDARPAVMHAEGRVVALMVVPMSDGRGAAVPLEAGWGLAAPFAGADPEAVVDLLEALWTDPAEPIHALFLSGLAMGGQWFDAVARRFSRGHRLGIGQDTVRRRARLDGGFDGFMARRSAKFRANLRRAHRKASAHGFTCERHTRGPLAEIYGRIIDIERRSWKGRSGNGIDNGGMHAFYEQILTRLIERDAMRAVLITRDGEDVAYCFGGLFEGTYRGMQVSFDNDYGDYALGNLAQRAMVEWLCEDGLEVYDLGSDMDYKARWGEETVETTTLVVMRKRKWLL